MLFRSRYPFHFNFTTWDALVLLPIHQHLLPYLCCMSLLGRDIWTYPLYCLFDWSTCQNIPNKFTSAIAGDSCPNIRQRSVHVIKDLLYVFKFFGLSFSSSSSSLMLCHSYIPTILIPPEFYCYCHK